MIIRMMNRLSICGQVCPILNPSKKVVFRFAIENINIFHHYQIFKYVFQAVGDEYESCFHLQFIFYKECLSFITDSFVVTWYFLRLFAYILHFQWINTIK